MKSDMGLTAPTWDSLGPQWQELGAAWLAAELRLSKSGKPSLTLDTLDIAELPSGLQNWAESLLRKESGDVHYATEANAEEMQDWVFELRIDSGEEALKEHWCTSGKVGLNLLLLGMKFWIDYDGASREWLQAQAIMVDLFQNISNTPSL
jgi:hypothetical protein